MAPNSSAVTLRVASPEDTEEFATIWYLGWQDAHLGFVAEDLVEARPEDWFRVRAAKRVADTTVAVVDGAVAGFVTVVNGVAGAD